MRSVTTTKLPKMNFLEAQKALLNILKLLGFFTYSVKSDVTRNCFHYVHCVIMSALKQGLFVIVHRSFLEKIDNYLGDGNRATNFFTTIEGYCVGLSFLIVYYSIFVCSSLQIEFIKTLLKIECDIRALKFSRSTYNERLRKSSFSAVLWTAFGAILLWFYLLGVTPEKHFVSFVATNAMYFAITLYLILLVMFIENLVTTVGNLADELNWNFQNFVTSCPFHFFNEDLKATLKLHDRLVESIAIFNRSFGIIVLGTYTYCFLIVSFECYYAYVTFFNSSMLSGASGHGTGTVLNILGMVSAYMPLIMSLSRVGFASETAEEKV